MSKGLLIALFVLGLAAILAYVLWFLGQLNEEDGDS